MTRTHEEGLKRWRKLCEGVLNYDNSEICCGDLEIEELEIDKGDVREEEVHRAIKNLKNGKAPYICLHAIIG